VEIDKQIEKVIESHGAFLYGLETIKDGDNTIFRVYITKSGGVDLDLCASISSDLSPLLDINPPVSGKYFLEVSSPGIERKLRQPNHFKSAIGERVKFKYDGKKIKGTVTKTDENGFFVNVNGKELFFNYNDISKAKTYFEWNK